MADDFRILKTGGELSGNGGGSNNNNDNSTWWLVGCTVFIAVGTAVLAYNYGKNSIAPRLNAAKAEKAGIESVMGNCPVYKKATSNSSANRPEATKKA